MTSRLAVASDDCAQPAVVARRTGRPGRPRRCRRSGSATAVRRGGRPSRPRPARRRCHSARRRRSPNPLAGCETLAVAGTLDLGPAVVAPGSIRFSSSQVFWPNSAAHSGPARRRPGPARCGGRSRTPGRGTDCPVPATRPASPAGSCRPAIRSCAPSRCGIAGADVEQPVRAEDHPAAVVDAGLGDAVEDHPRLAESPVAVVNGTTRLSSAAVKYRYSRASCATGATGDAEQAALAAGLRLGDRAQRVLRGPVRPAGSAWCPAR